MSKTFDEVVGEILALREEVADMRLRHGMAIDGLRTDVDGLRTDVDGLRTDVNGLRTDFDDLRGQFQTSHRSVSGELAALRAQVSVLEEGMADLRANQVAGTELRGELAEIRAGQQQVLAILARNFGH